MALCSMCQAIPDDFLETFTKHGWRQFYIHHPSFASFELSAGHGCPVCSFILSTFRDHHNWQGNWERSAYDFPCERERWDGSTFDAARVGPPENVASVDGSLPMFCVLRTDEEFRLAYRFGLRGVCLFFSIVTAASSNPFGLLPLHQNNFDLASKWIKQCSESHECGVAYDIVFDPTRLIDVGHNGQSPRLVEWRDKSLQNYEYVALSHCWGTSMPKSATTTKSTLSRRLNKIPLGTLPRTFRDAILATRKLGIRYLWIDSLCIVQDDSTDWQHESALMGKIYSHCYCMLAAVSSKDCHGRLFPLHDELPILKKNNELLLLKHLKEDFDPQRLLADSPLSLRGWTLQESELAPKVIYFTRNEMFFECREAYGHRNLPIHTQYSRNHQEAVLTDKALSDLQPVRRCLDPVRSGRKKLGPSDFQLELELRYDTWRAMVMGYSQCQLTIETDRFPALSGLASEYAFLVDDQYVAGLWRNDLIRGLCWRSAVTPLTPDGQTTHYQPSWSWAKISGAISYDQLPDIPKPMPPSSHGWGPPTIIDVTIRPQGSDLNGTLLSAHIGLFGCLFPLRQANDRYKLRDQVVTIFWDFLPQKNISYSLLNLGSSSVGLVLEEDVSSTLPGEKGAKKYRRVGIASTRGCDLDSFDEKNLLEITLV